MDIHQIDMHNFEPKSYPYYYQYFRYLSHLGMEKDCSNYIMK